VAFNYIWTEYKKRGLNRREIRGVRKGITSNKRKKDWRKARI